MNKRAISIQRMTSPLIDQIVTLAARNDDIAVVWLYGSRSTGQEQPHSDYDIAVAFKDFQLSSFERYLRPNELALDWSESLQIAEDKVSIIDINMAPIYLTFDVIDTGIVIYNDGSARLYVEQNRVYSQFEHQQIEQKRHA